MLEGKSERMSRRKPSKMRMSTKLMWWRSRFDAFEKWCISPNSAPKAKTSLVLSEFTKKHATERGEVILSELARAILDNLQSKKDRLVYVEFNGGDSTRTLPFKLDLSPVDNSLKIAVDTQPHLTGITVSRGVREVHLRAGIVGTVQVYEGELTRLELVNCRIAKLRVADNTNVDLRLQHCWIGWLLLGKRSIGHLFIERSTVRSLECPSPDEENPFTGSVWFPNDTFPTRGKLFKGSQPYSSLRAHLERLQNVPLANLMRTLELRAERNKDRGLNRAWNWIYDICANYGYSPGRPLAVAFAFYIVVVVALALWDGGILVRPADEYAGWQQSLIKGPIQRALYLPLQSFLSPLGVFPRNLVVAATVPGKIVLVMQGIVTYLLIGMTALGIRKRFKLP